MSDLLPSPQTELAAIKRGDTWRGIGSITIQRENAPLDLTGASVTMQLRKRAAHGVVVASWVTGLHSPDGSPAEKPNSIVITDAVGGVCKVLGRKMDVRAGVYAWDIEVTLAASAEWPDGRTLTIAQGTWKILQDVSR